MVLYQSYHCSKRIDTYYDNPYMYSSYLSGNFPISELMIYDSNTSLNTSWHIHVHLCTCSTSLVRIKNHFIMALCARFSLDLPFSSYVTMSIKHVYHVSCFGSLGVILSIMSSKCHVLYNNVIYHVIVHNPTSKSSVHTSR